MSLYVGIDLHSNASAIVIKNQEGRRVHRQRVPNDLRLIQGVLEPHRHGVSGVVVEATYNWYWLVDGLMDSGYKLHLANPAGMKQYEGLKHTDDMSDADWLAELLRLGILPEGYIYPKEDRPVRDLLRRRSKLVQQRTANILSIENLMARNTGSRPRSNTIKRWTDEDVDALFPNDDLVLAIRTNVEIIRCLDMQIDELEKRALTRVRLRPEFKVLLSINGVGKILALTIMLETGDIRRFPKVGDYASYCRCVRSERFSNGKKKGTGNAKCGNAYLAWAFVEAANFAVRFEPRVARFHQRKAAKAKLRIVATKAVAHKLARAAYHMLRNQEEFNVERAFA